MKSPRTQKQLAKQIGIFVDTLQNYKLLADKIPDLDELITTGIVRAGVWTINCDRTYKSVIEAVNKKGYVILDDVGGERTVKCCIPNLELKIGQRVWVTAPMGN